MEDLKKQAKVLMLENKTLKNRIQFTNLVKKYKTNNPKIASKKK